MFFSFFWLYCGLMYGKTGGKGPKMCSIVYNTGVLPSEGRVQSAAYASLLLCMPSSTTCSMSFGVDRSSAFPKEKQKLGNKGNLYTQSRTPFWTYVRVTQSIWCPCSLLLFPCFRFLVLKILSRTCLPYIHQDTCMDVRYGWVESINELLVVIWISWFFFCRRRYKNVPTVWYPQCVYH